MLGGGSFEPGIEIGGHVAIFTGKKRRGIFDGNEKEPGIFGGAKRPKPKKRLPPKSTRRPKPKPRARKKKVVKEVANA